MKVLSIVHGYPPDHNAGAEFMLHAINKHFCKKGVEFSVYCTCAKQDYEYEGVKVYGRRSDSRLQAIALGHDILITHLDRTAQTVRLAHAIKKPLVHIVHNHNQLSFNQVQQKSSQLAVFNSQWLDKKVAWQGRSTVLNPLIDINDYKTERSNPEYVTLVNCNESKGGAIFAELANRMPKTKFLGVLGGYGVQIKGSASNLTYVENSPNVKEIYAQTKVLLVLSDYESWGRAAVEAMANEIPVIAHPTDGLLEALGSAGVFCDRNDFKAVETQIKRLSKRKENEKQGKICFARAVELENQALSQLDHFYEELQSIYSNKEYAIEEAIYVQPTRKRRSHMKEKKLYRVNGTLLKLSDRDAEKRNSRTARERCNKAQNEAARQ